MSAPPSSCINCGGRYGRVHYDHRCALCGQVARIQDLLRSGRVPVELVRSALATSIHAVYVAALEAAEAVTNPILDVPLSPGGGVAGGEPREEPVPEIKEDQVVAATAKVYPSPGKRTRSGEPLPDEKESHREPKEKRIKKKDKDKKDKKGRREEEEVRQSSSEAPRARSSGREKKRREERSPTPAAGGSKEVKEEVESEDKKSRRGDKEGEAREVSPAPRPSSYRDERDTRRSPGRRRGGGRYQQEENWSRGHRWEGPIPAYPRDRSDGGGHFYTAKKWTNKGKKKVKQQERLRERREGRREGRW